MKIKNIHGKKRILKYFLNRDITGTEEILNIFEKLEGAKRGWSSKGYPYIFVPGKNENKVLLTAHCDTVWNDENYDQKLRYKSGVFYSGNPKIGIGADDRAGVAMLYLLRKSGNSLLVTTGEEDGMMCSRFLTKEEYDMINDHNFIVQLDKCGNKEFKCYSVGSEEFINYIKEKTGFKYIEPSSFTDIVSLCKTICGVNLSVGYYNEHTKNEMLVYDEWLTTLKTTQKLIQDSKKFELDRTKNTQQQQEDDKFGYNDYDILKWIDMFNQMQENGEIDDDDLPEIFL